MRCCKIDSNKDVKISIRISENDMQFLKSYAEINGISVSDAIRKLIKTFRLSNKTQ